MSSISSLVLMPDCLDRPMGGMGVQLQGILHGAECLPAQFMIVGSSGQPMDGVNFIYVPHVLDLIELGHVHAREMVGFVQASYVDAALWMAKTYGKPDVVHAFDWSTAYASILVARRLNVPLVFTLQLSYTAMMLSMPFTPHGADLSLCNAAFSIEQASIREAAAVIQVSQPYLDFWSQLMPEQARKMVVIGNGTEPCPPVNRSMEREDGLFHVGYMGRCALQKSAEVILEAVASDDWPPNCVLHWAGDDRGGEPALWQALNEVARTYPDRLKLVGYLTGQGKWDFLAGVDAVLFPSRHEPFGIAGLEVMAAGTPLITSGVDGIATYANETNAIIIPPTVMGILSGIKQAQSLLPHTRAAMVAAGMAEATRHDWVSIAKQVVDVYAYCQNVRSEFHVIPA